MKFPYYPKESAPVLAEITVQGDLGKSTWSEVVYYDEESKRWRSYYGSRTFGGGEKVVRWVYVADIWANRDVFANWMSAEGQGD